MARGPQVIAQPGGSVTIVYSATANSIQTAINANPGATTFWIEKGGGTGVRSITAALVPKTGNTLVFEYGAILDGSAWASTDYDNNAGIRAVNVNVDNVTIQNATIRHIPGKGIVGFYQFCDNWLIDHCELSYNRNGVSPPNNSVVSNCLIHHNYGDLTSSNANANGGGFLVFRTDGAQFIDNEIAYNGDGQQKTFESRNTVFRDNWVHHNYGNGLWMDGETSGGLIEDNIVEDNTYVGINIELTRDSIVRNNTLNRNGWSAIGILVSQDMEIYGNTCVDNWRGITLLLNFDSLPDADLQNNHIHHNTIVLGTRAGSWTNGFTYQGTFNSSVYQPYLTNDKNNLFIDNSYTVPATGQWWYWGNAHKTWEQWQAIPQDAAGMEFPGGSPSGSPGGGTGGTIGGGDGYVVVCSCFERNTGSGQGPWQLFADDGTSLGSATGTPFDPFGPGAFGMGRLANGRIWLAGETYFFTCADDFTDVDPTPQPGDPETPGPFHYTGFNGGQGGNYVYMIGLRTGFGAQNFVIEIDPTDWSEVRSWMVPSNYGFPNIGVDEGHTVAYYADQGGTVVKKMVLSSGTESNFLTGISGTSGIIVLPDDTVVIAHDGTVKRYNASATLLNTYSDGSPYGGQGNLAHGIDGNNSFLLMGTPEGSGRAHLYEFEVDTEAVLNDFEFPVYTGLRFEAPFSVIPAGTPVVVDPPPGTVPPPVVTNSTPCCGHDETTGPNPGPIPPGIGWEPQCLGGGLTPTAVALMDSENWDV